MFLRGVGSKHHGTLKRIVVCVVYSVVMGASYAWTIYAHGRRLVLNSLLLGLEAAELLLVLSVSCVLDVIVFWSLRNSFNA